MGARGGATQFSLDRVTVEHKSLGPAKPFGFTLPPPPSVNALFGQRGGQKRYRSAEYNSWLDIAGYRLKAIRPPRFLGQVWILITYADEGRFDINNRDKPLVDLLVKHGVIVNDSRKYLRELRLVWGSVTGVKVEIFPYPFSDSARHAA